MRLAFRRREPQEHGEGWPVAATDLLRFTSVHSELKSGRMNCRSHMNTRTQLCMTNEMSDRGDLFTSECAISVCCVN